MGRPCRGLVLTFQSCHSHAGKELEKDGDGSRSHWDALEEILAEGKTQEAEITQL